MLLVQLVSVEGVGPHHAGQHLLLVAGEVDLAGLGIRGLVGFQALVVLLAAEPEQNAVDP